MIERQAMGIRDKLGVFRGPCRFGPSLDRWAGGPDNGPRFESLEVSPQTTTVTMVPRRWGIASMIDYRRLGQSGR